MRIVSLAVSALRAASQTSADPSTRSPRHTAATVADCLDLKALTSTNAVQMMQNRKYHPSLPHSIHYH